MARRRTTHFFLVAVSGCLACAAGCRTPSPKVPEPSPAEKSAAASKPAGGKKPDEKPPGRIRPIHLKNPGFEDFGGVDGWNACIGRFWQNTDGRMHRGWYRVDPMAAHSGRSSQRISYIPGQSDPWGTVWQFTPRNSVRPGGIYGASVWCQVDGFQGPSLAWGGLRLAIRFIDADGNPISEARAPLDSNQPHAWRRIEVEAVAPERANRLQVVLYLHSESGTVWYDDVEVWERIP